MCLVLLWLDMSELVDAHERPPSLLSGEKKRRGRGREGEEETGRKEDRGSCYWNIK